VFANIFEQRTARRIPTQRIQARIRGGDRAGHRVLNLCNHGLCMELDVASQVDQVLELKLKHPHLPSVRIAAVVRWCANGPGGKPVAGLEFAKISAENRRAIRCLLAAEAGSCVLPKGGGAPVGFVAPSGHMWSFYDQNATRVAVLAGESPQYKLTIGREGPCGAIKELPVGSFMDAIRAAYDIWEFVVDPPRAPEGEPLPPAPAVRSSGRLAPPPPPPPPVPSVPATSAPASPSRPRPAAPPAPSAAKSEAGEKPAKMSGSAVMRADQVLGYVARTREGEWALFDPGKAQIGMLTQRGRTFTVFWLGESVDDSFESLEATNFAMAVAKAFELEGFPRLVSAVIEPSSMITRPAPEEAKKKDAPGSRVLHKRRLSGYVCEADMPNVWLVLTRDQEHVAIVNLRSGQFQVCLMGQSPDESMEYENYETLADATAFALHLPGRPMIDPPIPT
jgi:hypothetical protein